MIGATEAKRISFRQRIAAPLSVITFAAGIVELTLADLRLSVLPERAGVVAIFVCFATSALFGIVAAVYGKRWCIIISVIATLIILLMAFGLLFSDGV
jgi:hypothetical protein